jgi:hypothetical protein
MTDTPQTRAKVARSIWFAIRFIIFGVGGLVALWISWLSLIFTNDPPSQRWLSPYVAAPLSLVGALMMLYGGGQWGRWAYMWVFVAGPIVVSSLAVFSKAYPALDFLFATPLLLGYFALPMVASYLLVKRYYSLRDRQNLGQ